MKHLLFSVLFCSIPLFAFPDIPILFSYFQKDGITICINSEKERRYFFRHHEKLGWKYIKTVGDDDKMVVFIENARKKCDEYNNDTEKVLKEMKPLIIQERQIILRNIGITGGILGGVIVFFLGIIFIRKKR